MANPAHPPEQDRKSGGVTIGTVIGGIHNSIIAGRDVIVNTFTGTTEQQRAQRNRLAILKLVKDFWVKGVLEQSLHGAAMIELGMAEKADVVERPWDMVLQTPDQPKRILPPGTKMANVFDEMNGCLLILGEPGSGKTTMLLELARDIIDRAEEDLTQPIPVVFNLSSWAEKRQPMAEWLVDELNAKYNIPKRIARPWVENDDLLLLLDGLDEVKPERREACVKAINGFRQEHLVPMAVCSRVADYEALTVRLQLREAVLLQPLTPEQVDEYLKGVGIELLAARRTLQHHPTLQELVKTPLMLSIMTLAYRGVPVEELGTLDSIEAHRRHLFDAYMERMFRHRRAEHRYARQQTVRWLAWLAQKMTQHSQNILLIEQLQPSWLPTRAWCWFYVLVSRMIGGLLIGLIFGLSIGVIFGAEDGPGIGLFMGLLFGFSVGLSVGLVDTVRFARSSKGVSVGKVASRWQLAFNALLVGLVAGTIEGLVVFGITRNELAGKLSDALLCGMMGLIGGLIVGLFLALRGGRQSLTSDIRTVEALSWSWNRCLRSGTWGLIAGLAPGLILGLIAAIIAGLSYGLRDALSAMLFIWLIMGLIPGPIGAMVGTMFGGLSSRIVETKMAPNQGIRYSQRNAIFAGLILADCWPDWHLDSRVEFLAGNRPWPWPNYGHKQCVASRRTRVWIGQKPGFLDRLIDRSAASFGSEWRAQYGAVCCHVVWRFRYHPALYTPPYPLLQTSHPLEPRPFPRLRC